MVRRALEGSTRARLRRFDANKPVGLLATFHPRSATTDHRHAASSTLESPEEFLGFCVLAWRRRCPVFRAARHEKTH